MALIKADNDERMLRMLSLKSQQRNPPISSGKNKSKHSISQYYRITKLYISMNVTEFSHSS